jgi:hypothetical protein
MEEESNSRRLQIRRNMIRQMSTLRSSPYNSSLSNLRRRRRENSVITSQTINNLITNGNLTAEESDIIEDEEDFQVLVDLSNTSSIDLTGLEENNQNIDFEPDDDHQYYYYHSSSTTEDNQIQYAYDNEEEYPPSINNNNNNDDEDLSIEIILESSQNNSLSSIPRRRHSIIPFHNHGLRLSDILSIPQKLYSSLKQPINNNTQCYICLEDFQLIDSIKILHCQHIFHR